MEQLLITTVVNQPVFLAASAVHISARSQFARPRRVHVLLLRRSQRFAADG